MKNKLNFILIAVILAIKGIGCSVEFKSKIVGGTKAKPAEFPYLVSIQTYNGAHFCGGSLISFDVVLTASHCITARIFTQSTKIVAGTNNNKHPEQIRGIRYVYIHEDPDICDIGTIRLNEAFTESSKVKTISLLRRNVVDGEECVTAGWGAEIYKGSSTDHLMKIKVYIVNPDLCTKSYKMFIPPTFVCAQGALSTQDTCQGDSGGPIACGQALAGIVSRGYKCAYGLPGLYTRTNLFLSWIEEKSFVEESNSAPINTRRKTTIKNQAVLKIAGFTVVLSPFFAIVLQFYLW